VDFLIHDAKHTAVPMSPATCSSASSFKAPPRLLADQLINIYLQEWAPLFPILHGPALLSIYEEFVSNPESLQDPAEIAQINLVFGIAALSSKVSKHSYNMAYGDLISDPTLVLRCQSNRIFPDQLAALPLQCAR
jgi:hypothetical protein